MHWRLHSYIADCTISNLSGSGVSPKITLATDNCFIFPFVFRKTVVLKVGPFVLVTMGFRRFYLRCQARHPAICRYRILMVLLVVLLVTLVFLHLVLLPAVTGAYNDDCYLPMEKLESLRYAVQTISQMMEQCNKTYWLDYGEAF